MTSNRRSKRRASRNLRGLWPELPRDVWILQAGGLANAIGDGLLLPFMVIYLHSVRGFSLSVSGASVALIALAAVAASPAAGAILDRIDGARTIAASMTLAALGLLLLPLVRTPWHAFAVAILLGVGEGGFRAAQSALLAAMTSAASRTGAFAVQRLGRNFGIGLGSLIAGFVISTNHPHSFTVIFLVDAASSLAFAAVALTIRSTRTNLARTRGEQVSGYRTVFQDRTARGLLLLVLIFSTAGFGQFQLLAAFAHDQVSIPTSGIGLAFLANTLTIAASQLPVLHAVQGRRRLISLALMNTVCASAWLMIFVAGLTLTGWAAAALIIAGAGLFGFGECFLPIQSALIADLAPEQLRGRYLALVSTSTQLGLVVGPPLGALALAHVPHLLWIVAAGILLANGGRALTLQSRLPAELQRVPALRRWVAPKPAARGSHASRRSASRSKA